MRVLLRAVTERGNGRKSEAAKVEGKNDSEIRKNQVRVKGYKILQINASPGQKKHEKSVQSRNITELEARGSKSLGGKMELRLERVEHAQYRQP